MLPGNSRPFNFAALTTQERSKLTVTVYISRGAYIIDYLEPN